MKQVRVPLEKLQVATPKPNLQKPNVGAPGPDFRTWDFASPSQIHSSGGSGSSYRSSIRIVASG